MQEHDQKPVFLTQDFTEFTQLDADRLTILSRILEEKQDRKSTRLNSSHL